MCWNVSILSMSICINHHVTPNKYLHLLFCLFRLKWNVSDHRKCFIFPPNNAHMYLHTHVYIDQIAYSYNLSMRMRCCKMTSSASYHDSPNSFPPVFTLIDWLCRLSVTCYLLQHFKWICCSVHSITFVILECEHFFSQMDSFIVPACILQIDGLWTWKNDGKQRERSLIVISKKNFETWSTFISEPIQIEREWKKGGEGEITLTAESRSNLPHTYIETTSHHDAVVVFSDSRGDLKIKYHRDFLHILRQQVCEMTFVCICSI